MKAFPYHCFFICSTTLLICFTFACPQSYPSRFDQDYNQEYDDWEFAGNRRNNYNPGMNRINGDMNPMRNRGHFNNRFRPTPSMHQIEDRSYDLAYGLGQGYGKKLGDGIKSGIGKSFTFNFNKGRDNDKEKEGKREDP